MLFKVFQASTVEGQPRQSDNFSTQHQAEVWIDQNIFEHADGSPRRDPKDLNKLVTGSIVLTVIEMDEEDGKLKGFTKYVKSESEKAPATAGTVLKRLNYTHGSVPSLDDPEIKFPKAMQSTDSKK